MDPCFETATGLPAPYETESSARVEATEAHLERIARLNGPINALVVVDREGAMKAARAADRARCQEGRQARAAARRADHHQGGLRRRGPAHDLEPSAAQGQCRQDRRHPGRPAARGGRGDPGQDQCARAVRRLSDRQPAVRHDQEPLGRAALGRRLDRRRRGRRGRAAVAARARQRHRRLGAQSGALQRHLLAEADGMARARPRPCARPAGRHARRALHGHVRSARALGRRSRAGAAHHRRSRRLRGGGRRRCRSGRRRKLKARRPAHRGAREQSAGQGVGRYGQGRAGDGEAAVQGRRQGEARRARGARLAAGLGRLVRLFQYMVAAAAAAVGARALLRR